MSVNSALIFPPAAVYPVESGGVRAEALSIPGSGTSSTGEISRQQIAPELPGSPQDAVKVQWDKPDQIVIYQFVNQQGTLILQVPSEQMLNLAHQISQELAQEALPKEPGRD